MLSLFARSQTEESNYHGSFFIEPELMVGRIADNYDGFPEITEKWGLLLNLGKKHLVSDQHWARYYGFPTTGISLGVTNLGNPEVLGYELSVTPYLMLNFSKKRLKSWYMKLGLGGSYFTKFYHPESNPVNRAIGSRYSWNFQLFLYRSLILTQNFHLKVGAGYWHSSNGHTTLPNFGLNAAQLTVAAQFFSEPLDMNFYDHDQMEIDKKSMQWYFYTRLGLGKHELGDAGGPIGGPSKNVYTTAVGVALVLKHHLKFNSGFAYRYYQHYYDDILRNEDPQHIDKPGWEASNIMFFLTGEMLLGHVGMEFGGGINITKPYFKTYYYSYSIAPSDTKYTLKKIFTARLGLNYYLINTNKMPRNNVFAGVHINANFGQADFTEVSLGFVHRL